MSIFFLGTNRRSIYVPATNRLSIYVPGTNRMSGVLKTVPPDDHGVLPVEQPDRLLIYFFNYPNAVFLFTRMQLRR